MSKPGREYTAEEMALLQIGTELKDFLGTEAGKWLKGRLAEGQNSIAKEALLNPAKEFTLDYYRGRASELSSLSVDIEERVKAAEDLMSDESEDAFDSFDGPDLGGGSLALGEFGR